MLILHLILTVCQVSCWGIWMKPYLSGVSLCFQCWAFWYECYELISFFLQKNHITIIQVLSNHHHYDWCFLFYFAPGIPLCTNAHGILLIFNNLLLMTWLADDNCVWVWIRVSDYQIILLCSALSNIFISATEQKHCFSKYLFYIKSSQPDESETVLLQSFYGCY